MRSRINSIIPLLLIAAFSIGLAYPTISNNVNSPNLIPYFNSDEGYLMDLGWFYYSGEKRISYQMGLDYGLELTYVADILRLIISRYLDITPGILVLIVRWLHLVSWVGALAALWFLVKRHFGNSWKPILIVSLLAVRPAYDHCLKTLKPEPLVLLFMIIGINYILKMVDDPYNRKNMTIAAAFASLAFIVKFAGIFLLPAMIASLYIGRNYIDIRKTAPGMLRKNSWAFPLLLSVPVFIAPLATMFCYIRQTTGLTYFEEFGFWGSTLKYRIIYGFWLLGIALACASFILLYFEKKGKPLFGNIMSRISEINYYAMITAGLFAFFVALFGFKWFFNIQHFLQVYGVTSLDFTGGEYLQYMKNVPDLINMYLYRISYKINAFDPWLLALIILYAILEIRRRFKGGIIPDNRYYKRIVLAIYLLPCIYPIFFTIGTFSAHHMLSFFVAAAILSAEALTLFRESFDSTKIKRNIAVLLFIIIFIFDIQSNASQLIKKRFYVFHQKEDIVFEIARWWRQTIPADAKIVSDPCTFVYIPEEYENVKIFNRNDKKAVEKFRALVETYKPTYIYVHYNAGYLGGAVFPPVDGIFPYGKVKVAKVFGNSGLSYQRWPNDRFVIYEYSG